MADQTAPATREGDRKGSDRRTGEDRRKVDLGPPPPGLERRKGDRRDGRDRRRDG